MGKTKIEWADYTFQPLGRLPESLAGMRALLCRDLGQAHRFHGVGE